jgi:hypothetical protein
MADHEGTRRSKLVRCKQHGRIYDSAKTQCPACLAESKGTSPPPPQATPKRGAPPALLAGALGIMVLAIAGPKLVRVVGDALRSGASPAQGDTSRAGGASRGRARGPIEEWRAFEGRQAEFKAEQQRLSQQSRSWFAEQQRRLDLYQQQNSDAVRRNFGAGRRGEFITARGDSLLRRWRARLDSGRAFSSSLSTVRFRPPPIRRVDPDRR